MNAHRTTKDRGLRTRRAVGLVVMSAVVPGSAQYVAGQRRVGRLAMRVWAGTWLLVLLLALGLFLLRGPTMALLLNGGVIAALKLGAWAFFTGWALLLLDAWRLARPTRLPRAAKLSLTVACLVLLSTAGFSTSVAANALTAADNLSLVLRGGGDSRDNAGRYNVLLLGVDAASERVGIRPDSINVASVDVKTGRTVVFGLPRNLQGAPFPADSPLHSLYPDGFRCEDDACMLNGVFTLGEEHADLYPGEDAGLAATREVVSELLGLDINYHAMVDMAGFEALIDAMGGITVNVARDVPIGGGGSPVSGYVKAGEGVHLDGHDALWLARSRHGSSDYERMARQKCVMSAMAKQLDPSVVATRFVELSEAGRNVVTTDVGAGHVAELTDLALRAKSLDLQTVDFAPPLILTAEPDLPLIRSTVARSIAASETLDKEQPETVPADSASPQISSPSADAMEPEESADVAGTPSSTSASTEDDAGTPDDESAVESSDAPPICSVG